MPEEYRKTPLSIPKQITLLRGRGMGFADETQAAAILSRIHYSRLRGYWLTFEDGGGEGRKFKPNTRFEDVLALYRFDEDARNLLLRHLDKLEVFLRAQFSHHFAAKLGDPLAYRNAAHFSGDDRWRHSRELAKLDNDFKASNEHFAVYITKRYNAPPVWAAVEAMSFGQLSKWTARLNHRETAKEIGAAHGVLQIKPFTNFIHGASALRNICAHQNRLVYRERTILLERPKKVEPVRQSWQADENKPYNLLTFLSYVMRRVDGGMNLGGDLRTLSGKHGVPLRVLGFPQNWQSRPVWQPGG